MRLRIALSLICAAFLISGALWFRFSRQEAHAAGTLTVVSSPKTSATAAADEAKLEAIYNEPTSNTSTSTTDEQLTDTDLISRQLFSDYVSLSANGQATSQNLNALGDEYASDIVNLNKAPTINTADLFIVDSSKTNLNAYASAFSAIYPKYQILLNNEAATAPAIGDDVDAHFSSDTKALGSIYGAEAKELEHLQVPELVSSEHLKLVNIYITEAWALSILSDPNSDSATGYAAIAALQSASGAEQGAVQDIVHTLTDNGI